MSGGKGWEEEEGGRVRVREVRMWCMVIEVSARRGFLDGVVQGCCFSMGLGVQQIAGGGSSSSEEGRLLRT